MISDMKSKAPTFEIKAFQSLRVTFRSDGIGAQFQSRFIFQLLAGTKFLNKSLCWFYNDGHHGKGPMDGVGGTIKNVIFRKFKSGQIVFHTSKEFSNVSMKFVPSIITVYWPRLDEIVESESIHQAPSIPETLSIHKFVRQINDRGDCSIEFLKTAAVNQEAFRTQWYNKADDVACGHDKFDKRDNECSACRKWYAEHGSEWLQCPIFEQWFHEICFYV